MPRRAQCGDRLRDEDIDHRVLELARDVGPARVVERPAGRLAAHERQRRGLEAAEAHVEVAARKHRPRQRYGAVPSRLREARQRRSAGIRQAEQLGRLVEGLARGVVLRVTQQPVLPYARDFEQLAVTAGHQQRDERELGLRIGEQRREQMALHVMHADARACQARSRARRRRSPPPAARRRGRAPACRRCRRGRRAWPPPRPAPAARAARRAARDRGRRARARRRRRRCASPPASAAHARAARGPCRTRPRRFRRRRFRCRERAWENAGRGRRASRYTVGAPGASGPTGLRRRRMFRRMLRRCLHPAILADC